VLATLGGCPSAPRPILTDQIQAKSSYRYVAVRKGSDQAKTIETMVDRSQIVARFAKGDRVSYVVRDGVATRPLFERVPFQSLDKATLVVHVARVSDINGWGTEVNGEVHRDDTLRLDLGKRDLADAFTILQKLETAPLEAIESVWPGRLGPVTTPKTVAMFERGYVVDVDAQLVTGNPFDAETRVALYGLAKQTGYTRL
jgi:hypothetical protein